MVPENFWAGLSGDLLSSFFETLLGLLLSPLAAIATGLQGFVAQFFPL
ncbi:MAG TPA: hypothetical protein VMV94_00895 [Phycisphaerae bacterium]|nr:hypothetical protein [Phycisphaerae bacterium]